MADELDGRDIGGRITTSVIVASMLSARLDGELRVVSRTGKADPARIGEICRRQGVAAPKRITWMVAEPSPSPSGLRLEVSPTDVFLATSWGSAQAVRTASMMTKYLYLIHDDEPLLQGSGDELFMAREILTDEQMIPVVCSRGLADYIELHGFHHVATSGIVFEPAFPLDIYHPVERSFLAKDELKLFVHAEPGSRHNLFYVALRLLDTALTEGWLDGRWEVLVAGAGVGPLVFSNGVRPTLVNHLTDRNLRETIAGVDLAICLRSVPGASQAALSFAASGAVALTTRGGQTRPTDSSTNIVSAHPSRAGLIDGLRTALALAADHDRRQMHYERSLPNRSWATSLGPTIEEMAVRIGDEIG